MNEIIKKNGITYGIILGLFSVLVTTLIYVIDISLFINPWVGGGTIVISIIIGIFLISKTKKQLNGLISFKEAFTVYFIASVIGATISILFNIVLFNFVDVEAKETLNQLVIKYSVDMMQKFGAPASAINETIAKMGETDNYSIANLLKSLIYSFVGSAVFGLILALIFKSKPAQQE